MNTTCKKRIYSQPDIELIKLDNEISLALQSEPPGGPGESGIIRKSTPEQFNNLPFETDLG